MTSSPSLRVIDACWSRIGTRGDRSCPELARSLHCDDCEVFAQAAQMSLAGPATDPSTGPFEQPRLADRSAVLFAVGGQSFAIETEAIIEVGDASPPHRMSRRDSELFAGLIRIQGRLEPCISLSGVLGLAHARNVDAQHVRVLVASAGGQHFVFPVDSVTGIQRFHHRELVEVPATSPRNAFLLGLISSEGTWFGLLDIARICEHVKERIR